MTNAERALGEQRPTGGNVERCEMELHRPDPREPEAREAARISGRLHRVIGEELCASQRVEWDEWPRLGRRWWYTVGGVERSTPQVSRLGDSDGRVVRFAVGGHPDHHWRPASKHKLLWMQLERDA